MANNYIPTQYTIRNWGRIGRNTVLKPSPKGIIVLSGDNASGKTSTMTTIYPLLIAGNLRSSKLFNSFTDMTSKTSNKVTHRTNNNERTLWSSILNGTGANALHNKNGELITDRIAFASATLDNQKDAITFGVTVQIRDRKLPSNGQRWFIYRHQTNTVPDIVSYDNTDENMLSLNDFTKVNQEKFGDTFKVFDTDAAYRRALAYELYGIPAESADTFLTTYANHMQLIGSGSLIGSNIKLDDLKNNLRKASPEINPETISRVVESFTSEIKESRRLETLATLINDLSGANDLVKTAKFIELLKTFYVKVNTKEEKHNFLASKLNDLETKLENVRQKSKVLAQQKKQAESELAQKREIQKQQQSAVNTKKVLDTELSLLNEKQSQYKITLTLKSKLQNKINDLTERQEEAEIELNSQELDLRIMDGVITPLVDDILPTLGDLSLAEKASVVEHDLHIFNKVDKKQIQLENAFDNLSTFAELKTKIIGLLSSISLLPGVKSIIEKVEKEFESVTGDKDQLKTKYQSELTQLEASLKTTGLSKDKLKSIKEAIENVNDKISERNDAQKACDKVENQLSSIADQLDVAKTDLAEIPVLNDLTNGIASKQIEIDKINIPVSDIDEQVNTAEKVFNKISFGLNDLDHTITSLISTKNETNANMMENHNILQQAISSFLNIEVVAYRQIDPSFTDKMVEEISDISFVPTSFETADTKLKNKIISLHKLFDSNNDSAIEEATKYVSKLLQNVSEIITPSNPELPTIDGRIGLFIENETAISIDTLSSDIFEKLEKIHSELKDEFEKNKQFIYENNHAVSEFMVELLSKHMAFDQLLSNAESIMQHDTMANVIRINMTHHINTTLFSKEFSAIFQADASLKTQTNIVKSFIQPFIDAYEGPIDNITSDNEFIKNIQDKFDYRQWIDIEFLIANANSDEFNTVTQKTLNSGSGGEKTYIIMVPLFTMLTLHLSSSTKESIPKLALFDEFAHVLDDVNTTALLNIINRFELAFFATTPASKEFNLVRGNVPMTIYFVTPGKGQQMNNYTKTFEYKEGKNIGLIDELSK